MRVKHSITVITLCTAIALLLTGCQNRTKIVPSTSTAVAQSDSGANEATQLQQCRGELDAQKTIDEQKYKAHKVEFDRLMQGAARYSAVRNKVNNGTQDTVDALYRYKVNRLCSEIKQTLLSSLSDRAESSK